VTAAADVAAGPGPVNILLVDDHSANLQVLEVVLQELGQNLIMADCGSAALRWIMREDFAVILLDVQMQGMDGFETAELIRKHRRSRHTPIIFLTAFESNRLPIEDAYALGAVDYLVKPVVPKILRAKVHIFVDLFRKSAEIKRQVAQLRLLEHQAFEQTMAEERQRWELEKHRSAAAREKEISAAIAQKAEELHRVSCELREEVAERRRIEEQLRHSQRTLTDFVENAPLGLHWLGPDGTVLWANQAELDLLRCPREACVGRPVAEFFDDPAVCADLLRRLAADEAIQNHEVRRRCPDGTVRHVLLDANVYREEGRFIHARCFTRDVTEQKRAEAERRQLQARIQHTQKLESLGVLAGGIAHDFNNLLTGVLGNAGLALLEVAPGSTVAGLLEQVEKAALRAAELTTQMLAYSGKGRFVIKPLDLAQLVEEMVNLLQTVVSKKAALCLAFAPQLPAVEADPTQLRQVVMNLITNASDALGEDNGTIILRTGVIRADRAYLASPHLHEELPAGDYVFLEVHDDGCGMPPETLARIFDPFFTTKFTGRGLGLAAVLGIVRGHRGTIKVVSEPGEGTTFQVLLPCARGAAPAPPPPPPPVEASWRGRGTVLLVDDEEAVRVLTARALESAGFEVLVASNGRAALELCDRHGPRLAAVLLDLTMPQLGGGEVLRALKQRRADLPIILMSGYTEDEAACRFPRSDVVGFLQKPFRIPDLLRLVRRAVERTPWHHHNGCPAGALPVPAR